MHIADEVVVRSERPGDYEYIERLLNSAFGGSDVAGKVSDVRNSKAFIPEFSLVGEVCDRIVAHALLTPASIGGATDSPDPDADILALGPVAVMPSVQRRGIGVVLVKSAIRFAEMRGARGIIVAGPDAYFRRFGFLPAAQFGLTPGFDLDHDRFLALPLLPGALDGRSGAVQYAVDTR